VFWFVSIQTVLYELKGIVVTAFHRCFSNSLFARLVCIWRLFKRPDPDADWEESEEWGGEEKPPSLVWKRWHESS